MTQWNMPWTPPRWTAHPKSIEDELKGVTVVPDSQRVISSSLNTLLNAALDLLRDIRDNKVNAQDEADKFLRSHAPSSEGGCAQLYTSMRFTDKGIVMGHAVPNAVPRLGCSYFSSQDYFLCARSENPALGTCPTSVSDWLTLWSRDGELHGFAVNFVTKRLPAHASNGKTYTFEGVYDVHALVEHWLDNEKDGRTHSALLEVEMLVRGSKLTCTFQQ